MVPDGRSTLTTSSSRKCMPNLEARSKEKGAGDAREVFEAKVRLYQREQGTQAAIRLYNALGEVVDWVREDGHGRCVLNAANRVFGDKVKTETYRSVR